jgi:hypothetical protein
MLRCVRAPLQAGSWLVTATSAAELSGYDCAPGVPAAAVVQPVHYQEMLVVSDEAAGLGALDAQVPPPSRNYPDRNSELTEIYLRLYSSVGGDPTDHDRNRCIA